MLKSLIFYNACQMLFCQMFHMISITHLHDYPKYCAFQLSGILDKNKIINNLFIFRIKIFTLNFIERIFFVVVLDNLCNCAYWVLRDTIYSE